MSSFWMTLFRRRESPHTVVAFDDKDNDSTPPPVFHRHSSVSSTAAASISPVERPPWLLKHFMNNLALTSRKRRSSDKSEEMLESRGGMNGAVPNGPEDWDANDNDNDHDNDGGVFIIEEGIIKRDDLSAKALEFWTELWQSAEVLFSSKITLLLLLGPAALIGDSTGLLGESACFLLAAGALIPCAER